MNNKIENKILPDCPVRTVLSRVGDKWSLLVLYALEVNGTLRFKEIQKEVPDISQKMLTVTLRNLHEDGFVIRKAYPSIPPKVEYTITNRALTFMQLLNPLFNWAKENCHSIIEDRNNATK